MAHHALELAIFIRQLAGIITSVFCLTACVVGHEPTALSFTKPPKLHARLAVDSTDIWCTSLNGAQFMAITGWFSPDCEQGSLPSADFSVTAIESYAFGTVNTLVLRITENGRDLWIPLPEHEWA